MNIIHLSTRFRPWLQSWRTSGQSPCTVTS